MSALAGAERVTACSTGEEILDLLMDELAKKARGEPIDSEACEYAMSALAAAQLMKAGATFETVERMFVERPHRFNLAYDFDTEDISISVVWLDHHAEECPQEGCVADDDGAFACHGDVAD